MTELSADAKRDLLARLLRERAEQRQATGGASVDHGGVRAFPAPVRLPRDGDLALSFGQERMWFLDQLNPDSPVYNLVFRIGLSGRLDVETLRRSLDAVVARHEVLHTVFPTVEGRPVQRWVVPAPCALRVVDLREVPRPERDAEAHRIAAVDARVCFDLAQGPLFRATLLRLDEAEHVLVLIIHHIVSDGWSLNLLFQELTACYAAFVTGAQPALPALPIQYADFAQWHRGWLTGDVLAGQRAYWKERLGGELPALELPADRPRPATRTFEGATCSVAVAAAVTQGLRELSRRESVTFFTTLLAAFKTFLLRYAEQDDVVVGTLVAGRTRPEIERVMGFFVNTLPLRTDLSGDPTFRAAVRRTRDVVVGAHAHADYPFEKLIEDLQPERDLTRNPLFQVLFNMLSFGYGAEAVGPELRAEPLPSLDVLTVTDGLTLYAFDRPGQLDLCFVYSPELFDAVTIERMAGHFQTLLAGVVADPDRPLSRLPLLPVAEREFLLTTCNATTADFPLDRCFPEHFEAQVARTPDAIAVVDGGGALTYAELNRRANRIAQRLVAADIGPDQPVALLGERSIALLTWILAVFKAGGAYLPLDPRHPSGRHAEILRQSRARVVVVSDTLGDLLAAALEELSAAEQPTVLRSGVLADLGGDGDDMAPRARPDDIAYVIYTSGSTGVPKGAMVPHAAMLNHFWSKIRGLGLTAADAVVQSAPQGFDISVWQFLAALLAGGRVRIAPDDIAHEPQRLFALVESEGLSVLEIVPSFLGAYLDETRPDPGVGGFGRLRWLVLGGEALPPALCRRWLTGYPATPLVNGYGPSECADDVARHVIVTPPPEDALRVPIGRPIHNVRIYVVDRALALVPVGVPGELCVGGRCVGRGYLNDPARTAAVFVPDPFDPEPGRRLYRTGDRARVRPDGALEFLGRLDHQVKIRGHRIELGEIEAVVARSPSVKETVVTVVTGPAGDRLAAYVVSADPLAAPTAEALRDHVRGVLPGYMIPDAFVVLDAIPRNANGKVDRQALPAPASARGSAPVWPRTPVEEVVANAWAEVLDLPRVGVHENFFELGGHSLLATRVVSRLREAFTVDLPVRRLFEMQTVAELADYIDGQRRHGERPSTAPLVRTIGPDRLTPSFAQQRLWFFEQLEPGSAVYNVPAVLRLRGRLDVAALEASLSEIARRHEALRTTFAAEDGRPVQVIASPSPWTVPVADLRGLADGAREAAAEQLAAEEAADPFDLAQGPLARVRLLRLADDLHLLLITFHHIVADGWAFDVFLRELTALYEAQVSGRPAALPALPIQYADFAAWQRQALSGEALDDRLAYWKRQLAGAPAALELPVDQPRQVGQTFRGGTCLRLVEAPVRDRLQALSRRESVTLFMTLLAAFDVVLGRHSGQDDICVGVPVAGRTHADTEGLIGLFVNTLVLRTRLDGRPSFRELLRRVREAALDAYAHQDVPFEKLVETLAPERDLSRTPLFQVLVNMVSFGDSATVDLPELRMEPAPLAPGWATPSKFDITLYARESAEGLGLAAVYNAHLFSASRMEALLDQLVQVLAAVSDSPDADVMGVSLLTPAAAPTLPDPTLALDRVWTEPVHVRFRRHAEQAPARVAVVDTERAWTYGELERLSNQLARHLRGRGIGREDRVAIQGRRSAGLAWAMLGVLKAGAAFMILDPAYPVPRTLACLRGARPRGWIDLAGPGPIPPPVAEALAALDHLVAVTWPAGGDGAAPAWSGEAADALETAVGPDDLAYVVFTSGSTGGPKGIAGTHRPLSHFFGWHAATAELQAGDRFALLSGLAHDPLLRDVLGAFWVGATVCMPDAEQLGAPGYLARWLAAQQVSVAHLTPAMATLLTESEPSAPAPALPALRRVFFGADALTSSTVAAVRRLAPTARYVNFYGASETPQAIAWYVVPDKEAAARIPLGHGIADVQLLVLTRAGALAGVGELGEIHVRTPYLARGYVDDARLTAERFIANPFTGSAEDRVYRTGDLGRYRPDGAVEFCGRLDDQVKIRGFRVEPGEVEAALREHPGVDEAVVVLRGEGAEARLVAYLVAAPLAAEELRAFAKTRLPEHMIPALFVPLARLPLTPNGKVDRRALPAPEERADRPRVAPRTPVEARVAAIWCDVLRQESIGVDESFFDLGGHSLLATRVVSRLRGAFGIELPVRLLFEAPTVAALAARIERAQRADGESPSIPPISPRARTGPLPLSFSQERLWFFEQLEPGRDVYGITIALRLRGHLDVEALARSLTAVVARHETLRTTFVSVDGQPAQVIDPPTPWTVPVIDLRHLPPARRDAAAARVATEQRARPFDLAEGPLLRVQVARLDHDRHLLVLTTHHIVIDGWASELLVRELAAVYAAEVTGRPAALAPLPIQYADFALWQRQWLAGETFAAELAYWKHHLAGAPAALDLPLDRPRLAMQTFTGSAIVRVVGAEVRDALHALSRREGATLFMTVLAVFKVLLARHSGQDDVCVGVPVAGRHHAETEPLIGVFINTLVLRTRLDGCPSFRELLRRVRETALGAYAHAELPFEKLVEALQPERDLSRTPLFQVLFNMLNFGSGAPLELPGLEVEMPPPSMTDVVASKFDLTLYARDEGEALRLTAVYNADLFAEPRMEALLDQLVRLLGAVAADADVDLARVPLVTAATVAALPDPTTPLAVAGPESVVARFRAHAAAAPQRPAVVAGRRVWTYGELEAQSNQLARHLIEHGVGREDRVAIFASRSAGLAWALLGVLKAGAGFMCLDPAHPPARTVACLRVAPPRAWIHLDGAGLLPPPVAQQLAAIPDLVAVSWPSRSSAADPWTTCAAEAPGRGVGPDDLDDLAYVAFTSGSTGTPKAIAGTQRPLVHFFAWQAATFGLGADDRFAALSGLAHDPLLRDVLGAFWVGATVCLPESERLATPGYLAEWLSAQRVSVMNLTPPMATVLLERAPRSPAPTLPSLRRVFFGAAVLTTDVVDRMRVLAPHAQYVNFYGATETPQAVAWYRIPERLEGDARSRIPLGRGITDAQLLVVNAAGDLAGIGEVGEIQVRTPYLARGYFGDPELTAERFVANPFTGAAADRVYRTGDLGRYRPDGTVEFHGRADGQVKIRGFRVELGDVEAALRRCPGVGAAVANVRNGQLIAHVVADGGERPTSEELRRHVVAELPGYMVPSIFVAVDRLPLTPNGKVDVAALPRPPLPARGRIAPRTTTETALVQVWRDVLAVEDLGVEDNFFELGGHSLLAVRLFARIEHVFGLTLPLATLFQAPTIERQAALIDRRGLDGPWRALVPIQSAGSRPPVFAIPGLGGIVVAFNNLATLLGPDQPFYGLQPRGLDGRQPPFETIEVMAEHYLTEVRAVQPHGPYFLIGVCMGGLVAFEMAQRLRTAGEEVAFLALLDVRPPQPLRRWMPAGRRRLSGAVLRLVASRLAAYGRTALQWPSRKQVRELVDRARRIVTLASTGDPLQGARGELYRQLVTAANAAAMHRYVPRQYPGSLVLVMAADRKYTRGKDRRLDWRRLVAGGVDICIVPGADSGLTLVDPNVRTLAQEFRARLERATARPVDVGD